MASMQEEAETSIIKSDRVGRTQYSREYKDRVVAAYEQSGMSGAAFAAQCGINPTFASSTSRLASIKLNVGSGEVDGVSPPSHCLHDAKVWYFKP